MGKLLQSVHMYVRLFTRTHQTSRPNFEKFSVCYLYQWLSLTQTTIQYDASFEYEIMFSHNGAYSGSAAEVAEK